MFNTKLSAAGRDTIMDFTHGEDKLVLHSNVFAGLTKSDFGGDLAYDTATGLLSYQGTAFALLKDAPELTVDDIRIV